MLKVGQTLWWVDHNAATEGTVIVHEVEETRFSVWYNGKIYYRPYSIIGIKLFYTPQLLLKEPDRPEKSCKNCFLRYCGECTSIRNELCEDYRAKQITSKEEQDTWPDYGDASTFRMKKRKPIKKEKW